MQSDWLDTVVTVAKDAPVVTSAGVIVAGYNIAPYLNGLILVCAAVWALIRMVSAGTELYWKWRDRYESRK